MRRNLAAMFIAVVSAGLLAAPAAASFPGVAGRIVVRDAGYITTMNLDGSGERELALGSSPAWSPDGGTIVFENDGSLFVINADGSDRRRLPVDRGFFPAWAPDGTRLAFFGEGSGSGW